MKSNEINVRRLLNNFIIRFYGYGIKLWLVAFVFLIFLFYLIFSNDNDNFIWKKSQNNLNKKYKNDDLLKSDIGRHLQIINKNNNQSDYLISNQTDGKNFNEEFLTNDLNSDNYQNSCSLTQKFSSDKLVKVGILHSLTGTMSISENSVVDSVLLAIEEINNSGGVLGRQIEAILEDGASDWPTFSDMAQKLIDQEKVDVVFGCWTSASRKAVLPIFEQKDHLLFYPVQYEGQECSKNIFYTGAAPNQQITPAVEWLAKKYPGKDFFLIGSDYVFPRTANLIIKNQVITSIGRNVWEQYIPLGDSEVESVFQNITRLMPNGGIIFNTLNGDTNVAFFNEFKKLGFSVEKYPTMSVSIAEEEVKSIGIDLLLGHYAVWNYFMTVSNTNNDEFKKRFFKKYGKDRVLNDPMEAAYIAVYIWKQAVESGNTTEINKVRKFAIGQEFEAPEGKVKMGANHHLSKYVRIGRVNEKGLFDIIMETDSVPAQPWNKYVPEFANNVCDFSKE